MSDRAQQLHDTIDRQIVELTELVSNADQSTLKRPCSGRGKLGDGTVAASAQHTGDNYQRIAAFIQTSDRMYAANSAGPDRHRIPRFMRALSHRPPDHAGHSKLYAAARVDQPELLNQLGATRATLRAIASLTESQLASIPPEGSFRFCDGIRSLEQVLAALLKHQEHQLEALRQAVNS